MTKRVLIVGQCGADYSSISRMLQANFDVECSNADSRQVALKTGQEHAFDLVLVNRILDRDGSAGLEVVRDWVGNHATGRIPIMLVSNFADAKQEAVELGAVPGFGKSQLHDQETLQRLGSLLGEPA